MLALGSGPAGAAVAVTGIDRAVIEAPADAPLAPYADNGYRLEKVGERWRITVEADPLESSAPFAAVDPRPGGAIGRLAHAVTAGSRTRYEAVSKILGWVAANLHYRLDRSLDQRPETVLARRDAYCTGYARLSVALLTAVGIEAREVAGVLLEPTEGSPAGYHRWIEVYYPDRGWTFSDPRTSHHYVTAAYLPLAAERAPAGLPEALRLVERRDDLWPVDRYDAASGGVSARRNHALQLGGTIRVELEGADHGAALLEGEGLRRRVDVARGAATFTGVDPGTYTLRFVGSGLPAEEARLLVTDRQRLVLRVPECARAGRDPGRENRPCVVP
ncbi:MAG: transglutaminase domain-containing protein, partial [Acidobacteria bacterium]|nr:transglutaminase domain-containing protein [Acidobacteriota bacterium]